MGRFNHSCVGFAMRVHPCTLGRFMMSHSYRFSYMDHSHRMDASTTHRLS